MNGTTEQDDNGGTIELSHGSLADAERQQNLPTYDMNQAVIPTQTAALCLGNFLDHEVHFLIRGSLLGRVVNVPVTVPSCTFTWTLGWDTGIDKMLVVQTEKLGQNLTQILSPFLSTANIALFNRCPDAKKAHVIYKSVDQELQAFAKKQGDVEQNNLSIAHNGTAAICLGNYIQQPTKFMIRGSQEGQIVEQIYTVEPNQFAWTIGWEAGIDKMVVVQTNGGLGITIPLTPFTSTTNIALFNRC